MDDPQRRAIWRPPREEAAKHSTDCRRLVRVGLAISNGTLLILVIVGLAMRGINHARLLGFLGVFPVIAIFGLVLRMKPWVRVCAVLPSGVLWFLVGVTLLAGAAHDHTERRVRLPLTLFLLLVGGLSLEPLFPSRRGS